MENNNPLNFRRNKMIDRTNIYSGGVELIDSNTLLFFDSSSPLEIEEIFNPSFKITIRIINENDDTGTHSLQYKVIKEESIIEYKCINFNNSLGTGTSQPMEIFTINGKKYYIHFWIYTMSGEKGTTRKLDYSLWKEK